MINNNDNKRAGTSGKLDISPWETVFGHSTASRATTRDTCKNEITLNQKRPKSPLAKWPPPDTKCDLFRGLSYHDEDFHHFIKFALIQKRISSISRYYLLNI